MSAAAATTPPAHDDPVAAYDLSILSQRLREVALLRLAGMTPRVIAQKLGVAKRTVDTYFHQIRRALGIPHDVRKPGGRPRKHPRPAAEPANDVLDDALLEESGATLDWLRRSRSWRPRNPKTISGNARLSRGERRAAALVVYPEGIERPRTRDDCANMPRPCPFVSCAHHLYLDVNPESGAIKLNFPHLEVWEMAETCSLDVADRGGITLEEVGAIVNLTRERIRQIEVNGARRIRLENREALGLP